MKTNKEEEAAKVRSAFTEVKKAEKLTQRALAKEFGVSTSLINGWLVGTIRIPDKVLLQLRAYIPIDPFEIRPDLRDYADIFGAGEDPSSKIGEAIQLIKTLPDDSLDTVISLMRVLHKN